MVRHLPRPPHCAASAAHGRCTVGFLRPSSRSPKACTGLLRGPLAKPRAPSRLSSRLGPSLGHGSTHWLSCAGHIHPQILGLVGILDVYVMSCKRRNNLLGDIWCGCNDRRLGSDRQLVLLYVPHQLQRRLDRLVDHLTRRRVPSHSPIAQSWWMDAARATSAECRGAPIWQRDCVERTPLPLHCR